MSDRDTSEIQVLEHEAWPGYLRASLIIASVFVCYLILMFVSSGMVTTGGHH